MKINLSRLSLTQDTSIHYLERMCQVHFRSLLKQLHISHTWPIMQPFHTRRDKYGWAAKTVPNTCISLLLYTCCYKSLQRGACISILRHIRARLIHILTSLLTHTPKSPYCNIIHSLLSLAFTTLRTFVPLCHAPYPRHPNNRLSQAFTPHLHLRPTSSLSSSSCDASNSCTLCSLYVL